MRMRYEKDTRIDSIKVDSGWCTCSFEVIVYDVFGVFVCVQHGVTESDSWDELGILAQRCGYEMFSKLILDRNMS